MIGEPPNAWRARMRGARLPDDSPSHAAQRDVP
jgi:AraC family transcriptional regulator